jgi:hypothetical protein
VQRALLVDGFKVTRYEDDNKLQIKFTALFADEAALAAIHLPKGVPANLFIEPSLVHPDYA